MTKLIFYQNRINKTFPDLTYNDLLKRHPNIIITEDKIDSVVLTKNNIVYVFNKKGHILQEIIGV